MEKPNTEQASMSGRWWQTRKWVVYITACYALHVILVINYVVLLVLYADGLAALVPIPTKIPNDVATASVTFILQTLGTGYSIFLVWITQRLALRRELLQKQTLTAIHDKASAWNGLGAGLNSLWDQSRVNGSTSGVFLVIVYLGGIFVLHITSGSLISAVAPNDCLVPDIFGGPCQVNLSLNINLTQVCVGLLNSVVLLTSSSLLIRGPRVGKLQTMEPSSCGVLQVIWLSSHHRDILEVFKITTPETSELRKVGSDITTVFGEVDSEPVKGSDTP